MKTKPELRQELEAKLKRLIDAEIADSWKGAGDPADFQTVELELCEARQDYDMFVELLFKNRVQ